MTRGQRDRAPLAVTQGGRQPKASSIGYYSGPKASSKHGIVLQWAWGGHINPQCEWELRYYYTITFVLSYLCVVVIAYSWAATLAAALYLSSLQIYIYKTPTV